MNFENDVWDCRRIEIRCFVGCEKNSNFVENNSVPFSGTLDGITG